MFFLFLSAWLPKNVHVRQTSQCWLVWSWFLNETQPPAFFSGNIYSWSNNTYGCHRNSHTHLCAPLWAGRKDQTQRWLESHLASQVQLQRALVTLGKYNFCSYLTCFYSRLKIYASEKQLSSSERMGSRAGLLSSAPTATPI